MTAEDLKVQYEADLREGVGNLLVSNEELRGLYARLCASRRMAPGELRANLLRMLSATVPNTPRGRSLKSNVESIGGCWNGGIVASHTPYDGEPSYG